MFEFLKNYKRASAFFAAFMLQLWFDIAAYAANNRVYALGLFISFTYPMIAMIPMLLIVEESTPERRFKIAMMEGLGYSVATAIFMSVRDWHR